MASPPYRSPAASPPYPAHITIPNPRKRPSLAMPLQGSTKRQKPSSFSASSISSAHPLRQTSFPPEESVRDSNARSPSVESDFTTATGARSVTTSAVEQIRSKGKRRKVALEGSMRSGKKGVGEGRSTTGDVEDEDEGEEEVEGQDGMVEEGGRVDRAAEKEKMSVLINAFNADQTERYNLFRRVKLRKETVRRITNQTLSQSVPPSVITTITGFTKVFIGILIERAREIQAQTPLEITPPPTPGRRFPSPPIQTHSPSPHSPLNISSSSQHISTNNLLSQVPQFYPSFNNQPPSQPSRHNLPTPYDYPNPLLHQSSNAPPPTSSITNSSSQTPVSATPPTPPATQLTSMTQPISQPISPQSTSRKKKPTYLGPLLPDHFREALRRYRQDGEGGGSGVEGTSLGFGIPGGKVLRGGAGGRRLFR